MRKTGVYASISSSKSAGYLSHPPWSSYEQDLTIRSLIEIFQALIIFTSINYPPLKLGNYHFPSWSYKLGWGLTGLILSGIVLYALYAIVDVMLIQRKVDRIM